MKQRYGDTSPDYYAARLHELGLLERQGASSLPGLAHLAARAGADPRLRALACWYLARLGPRDGSREVLFRLLDDAEPFVRAEAARSLGVIRDRTAVPSLAEIAKHGGDTLVRTMAIQSLAMIGGAAAANTLLALLGDEHEPEAIRASAAEHLGHLGANAPGVIAGLRAALSASPEVARQAAVALELLGDRVM